MKNLDDIVNLSSNVMDKIKSIKTEEDAKKDPDISNVRSPYIVCKKCGKLIPLNSLKTLDTFLISGVPIDFCDDCWNEFKKLEFWTIICLGCKEIKLLGEPIRNNKTGFELKKNTIYHFLNCPACHPECFKNVDLTKEGNVVPILTVEEAAYNKKYGYKF